jgi:hypothetical protein
VVSADTIRLFLLGLPALLAGTWLGMKLYGRLDEAMFRRVVLILLLVSGAVLIFFWTNKQSISERWRKRKRARHDRERSWQAGTAVATGCPKMECENATGL